MLSIAAEIKKLEEAERAANSLATSAEVEQALIQHPPEGVDSKNWKQIAKDLARNHGALIIAGATLVGANSNYAIDAFHQMMTHLSREEYLQLAIHSAKAISFAGFALEKAMHVGMGGASAASELADHAIPEPKKPGWYKKMQDGLKRLEHKHSVRMGPVMFGNHGFHGFLNALEAFADPANLGAHVVKAASRAVASGSIAAASVDDLEKRLTKGERHGGTMSQITAQIAYKMQGTAAGDWCKNNPTLLKYGMASPWAIFLAQDIANGKYGHASLPLLAVIGYMGLGYFMESQGKEQKV